jgi:hypothetical protein
LFFLRFPAILQRSVVVVQNKRKVFFFFFRFPAILQRSFAVVQNKTKFFFFLRFPAIFQRSVVVVQNKTKIFFFFKFSAILQRSFAVVQNPSPVFTPFGIQIDFLSQRMLRCFSQLVFLILSAKGCSVEAECKDDGRNLFSCV